MSDGSISQSEIDALLSGGGGLGKPVEVDAGPVSSVKLDPLKDFVSGNISGFSANLQTMTGKSVTIAAPVLQQYNKEAFIQKLPDMAISASLPFTGSLTGEHTFVLLPDFVKKLVSLVNHEDSVEIDDMGLAVISETMAQYAGTEATAFDRVGFKGITSAPAESVHVAKAELKLPQDNFTTIEYKITLDGDEYLLWEIIPDDVTNTILANLGGGNSQDKVSMQDMQSMIQGSGSQSAGANMQGAAQMMGMQNMGMPNMGMQPSMNGGMGIVNGNPSIQSVQFPPLQNFVTQEEQGNIGLIMDVYMEMTVELGRTKRTIREILGMGEGHIIELDKLAGEPVDILVNHKPIAKGEVVVIEENFGVRVTEILSPAERITDV